MSWTKVIFGKLGKTYSGLSGKSGDDFGSGKPFITYMNVFSNGIINPTQTGLVEIKKTEKQNIVKKGDLLFTTSSETIAEVGMTSVLLDNIEEVYLNSFCFGFRPYNFDLLLPEFVPYLFRGEKVRHSISMMGQGSTRYNLRKTELLSKLELELPSKPEQTRIAQILSTADRAIAQTEALIAKYQRIKTGLMQDLLTKGIDEHGNIRSEQTHRFKTEKGLSVPEEWEVKELEKISIVVDSLHQTPSFIDDGFPMIRVNNVADGYIDLKTCAKVTENTFMAFTRNLEPQSGDIVISRVGSYGLTLFIETNDKICIGQNTAIIRPKINNYYLNYFLKSRQIKLQIEDTISGSSQKSLSLKAIRNLLIALPKNDIEQERISQRIMKIDLFIKSEEKKLSKLKSLKTGLMQDLLSGKVRVKTKEKEMA